MPAMKLFRWRHSEDPQEPARGLSDEAVKALGGGVLHSAPLNTPPNVFTQTDPERWIVIGATAEGHAWAHEPTEEHTLTTAPSVSDTGSHHLEPDDPDEIQAIRQPDDRRPDCPHCHGQGKILTVRDWLDEIVGFLPTDPASQDAMIAEFYKRLLTAAPWMTELFPPDLTTGEAINTKGHNQRDQLLKALVRILSAFDPADPGSPEMQQLDKEAAQWGRSHANFERSDGTYGATPDEYLIVRDVLASLFAEAVPQWETGHMQALAAAYHHVMVGMQYAQQRWVLERAGQLHPRSARAAASEERTR